MRSISAFVGSTWSLAQNMRKERSASEGKRWGEGGVTWGREDKGGAKGKGHVGVRETGG